MRFGLTVVLLALVNKCTVRAIARKATGWTLETEEHIAESQSSGCNQQNLKTTLEMAGQEGAIRKIGKHPAKESTVEELVACALEGFQKVK